MLSPAFKTRVRYQFDTFLAKGGSNIFISLFFVFLVTLVTIALLRGVLLWTVPSDLYSEVDQSFLRQLYVIFLEMTDPGNMNIDKDSGVGYKTMAILAGLAGVVIFSALIAVITTALEAKIDELKKGHSKVVESDHTLILGWNDRVPEIIRELVIANESERDACVVILSEQPKEEMDDFLKMRMPDRDTTRIVTRTGVVSSLLNLETVSMSTCKSVIVLGNCTDASPAADRAASDTRAIKTLLGVMAIKPAESEIAVVAEVYEARNREIVSNVTKGEVITFDTLDILSKILVQTSRSNGLSVVYSEIMSFDGCEMYFTDGDWGGARFGEMQYHFPDGVLMGIRRADGELLINPPVETPVQSEDDLLILADDDSTIEYRPEPVAPHRDLQPVAHRVEVCVERELIIGWNPKTMVIIREYNDYVKEGSQIDMLIHRADSGSSQFCEAQKQLDAMKTSLPNLTVALREADLMADGIYEELDLSEYNNVLVLSQGGDCGDPEKVDSETIIILLMLRNQLEQLPIGQPQPKLITEVMDSKNQSLVARAGVNDFIISNRQMSMLVAQISEEPDILRVYDQIFSEDGSEIYIKSIGLYFDEFPVKATFADLMSVAQNREEICLGVKLYQHEGDLDENYGVKLIPEKNTVYELGAEDHLVVLAEDEF
jgi:ion channel POLLUX/CASTOR